MCFYCEQHHFHEGRFWCASSLATLQGTQSDQTLAEHTDEVEELEGEDNGISYHLTLHLLNNLLLYLHGTICPYLHVINHLYHVSLFSCHSCTRKTVVEIEDLGGGGECD